MVTMATAIWPACGSHPDSKYMFWARQSTCCRAERFKSSYLTFRGRSAATEEVISGATNTASTANTIIGKYLNIVSPLV